MSNQQTEIARMAAEIEQLREAGDRLAALFNEHGEQFGHVQDALQARTTWNELKEHCD